MKQIFTLCCIALLALSESIAQEYPNLQSVSSEYGSLTALTALGDSITSTGRRGNAKSYSGRQAISYEGKYYFMVTNETSGDELWVSDGTREGTMMIKDINPGAADSQPGNLLGVGGKVYFSATTVDEGTELWVTDGTEAGTNILVDIFQGQSSSLPNTLTAFKNGFLFAAVDANSSNYDGDDASRQHMWFSDGTPEGTQRLSADNRDGVQPKTTGMDGEEVDSPFQIIGDTLAIFGGTSDRVVGQDGEIDLIEGQEIWVTNGTPEPWGTKILVDINPPTDASNIQWLYTANEKQVVFRSKSPGKWNGQDDFTTLSNEWWVTDGSTKGTYLLEDWNDRSGVAFETGNTGAAHPRSFNDNLYFRGNTLVGNEISTMNSLLGDAKNFTLAYDIAPFDVAQRSSNVDDLVAFDGKLWFKADFRSEASEDYPRAGQELAMYDPELDFVHLAAEIWPGTTNSSFPRNKTIVNGRMYFTARDNGGYNVYAIDVLGDDADPVIAEGLDLSRVAEYSIYRVFDDIDGFGGIQPTDLRELNGNLMFSTIEGHLAVFDDGLTKADGEYVDPKATGLPVAIGANEYLNAPPMATFTSPSNGDILVEGATVNLAVNLDDPEGDDIVKVEYYTGDFYNEWNLIGTSTTGDYSFDWENIPAGVGGAITTVTAVAFDAEGSSLSMPIDIRVDGNAPPVVALTLPSSDLTVTVGSAVEIAATASDELDGLTVDFYSGDDLLFSDSEEPYGYEWEGSTDEGVFELYAIATDFQGATATTDVINVTFQIVLEVDFVETLSLYPNPAVNGYFNIANGSDSPVTFTMVDLSGKMVLNGKVDSGVTEVSVRGFKKGIYSMLIKDIDGISQGTAKIIVE